MARMSKRREARIDSLDQQFHDAAGELAEMLAYSESMRSEGHMSEAFGKAVVIARQMLAIDAELAKLDWSHEGEYDAASADVRAILDGPSSKRRARRKVK